MLDLLVKVKMSVNICKLPINKITWLVFVTVTLDCSGLYFQTYKFHLLYCNKNVIQKKNKINQY